MNIRGERHGFMIYTGQNSNGIVSDVTVRPVFTTDRTVEEVLDEAATTLRDQVGIALRNNPGFQGEHIFSRVTGWKLLIF
jgi:hypothetical protein